MLDVSVPAHSWPFGIIPTASNAVTVAIGDALAIALLVSRDIKEEDFALLHPGGLLGRKMLTKTRDLMHTGDALPLVKRDTGMRNVLMEMTAKRLGVTCVVGDDMKLEGVITDGDLRRLLERSGNPLDMTAEDVMTRTPKSISADTLSARALHLMEKFSITSLAVTDEESKLIGIIHMHDILRMETNR